MADSSRTLVRETSVMWRACGRLSVLISAHLPLAMGHALLGSPIQVFSYMCILYIQAIALGIARGRLPVIHHENESI